MSVATRGWCMWMLTFGEHTQQEGFPAEHENPWLEKHAPVLTPVRASWFLYPTQANPFPRNPGMPQQNGPHHLWDTKWCARNGEINTGLRWREKVKHRVTKNHWNPCCHVKGKIKGRRNQHFQEVRSAHTAGSRQRSSTPWQFTNFCWSEGMMRRFNYKKSI